MNFAIFIPIMAIAATAAVIIAFIYRPRRVVRDKGTATDEGHANARLTHENERLKLTVERLEERIAVLERIATDPAERTAREIEQLRQNP